MPARRLYALSGGGARRAASSWASSSGKLCTRVGRERSVARAARSSASSSRARRWAPVRPSALALASELSATSSDQGSPGVELAARGGVHSLREGAQPPGPLALALLATRARPGRARGRRGRFRGELCGAGERGTGRGVAAREQAQAGFEGAEGRAELPPQAPGEGAAENEGEEQGVRRREDPELRARCGLGRRIVPLFDGWQASVSTARVRGSAALGVRRSAFGSCPRRA
jgi:hypothetical protein